MNKLRVKIRQFFAMSDLRVVMRLVNLLTKAEQTMVLVSLFIRLLLVGLDIVGLALVGVSVSLVSGVKVDPESVTGVLISFFEGLGFGNVYALFGFGALTFFLVKGVLALRLNALVLNRIALVESRKSTSLFRRISLGNLDKLQLFNKQELGIGLVDSFDMSVSKLTMSISVIFGELVLILGICTYLALVDLPLLLIVGAYLLMLGLALHFTVANKTRITSQRMQKAAIDIHGLLLSFYDNFRQIKSIGKASHFVEKFQLVRNDIAQGTAQMSKLAVTPRYVSEIGVMFGFALLILQRSVFGGSSVSATTMALFVAGSFRIVASILPLQGALALLKQITGSSDLALELNSHYPAQVSSELECYRDHSEGPLGISISRLDYHYPGQSALVLKDISIEIRPGSYVAIVGPSGSGKSTLADLVLGLRAPSRGLVCINSMNAGDFVAANPRSVAYVPQRSSIFEETLAYNVSLEENLSESDRDQVLKVISQVGLTDWVESLPEGIETTISETSRGISGGQSQRIGLARALFQRPRLIILDESTSALDVASENLVLETLEQLRGEVTIIAIAHRGNVISKAESQIVLEMGKLTTG